MRRCCRTNSGPPRASGASRSWRTPHAQKRRKPRKGRRTSRAFYQRTSVGCAHVSACPIRTQSPTSRTCPRLARRSYPAGHIGPLESSMNSCRPFENWRMKQVELFRWWVRAPGRKRAHLTDFLMDAAAANAEFPGARPDPTSRTVRNVPETDAEQSAASIHPASAGHDSVKPPRAQ
jgi:hypothetical protein